MPASPVGTDLRVARLAAGLTIDELAVHAGVGSATVERIEAGRVARPHRSTRLALALALAAASGRSPSTSNDAADHGVVAKTGVRAPEHAT